MPVKTEDQENCIFNEVEFNMLLDGFGFLRSSGEYKNCALTYLGDIPDDGEGACSRETKLGNYINYIKLVGSDQRFRNKRITSDRDFQGWCVSCGEYVYFVTVQSNIVYRGLIDDVEYTESGSIAFVKHGSEKEQT